MTIDQADRPTRLGIIGGSGLHRLGEMVEGERIRVDTPFGDPSDEVLVGRVGDMDVAVLPRHGRGHQILPTEINARANVFALKAVGCTHLLSFSAAGSLREDLPPGTFVLPDQFIDRTFARAKSFFGDGIAAHVGFADPTCGELCARLAAAGEAQGLSLVGGGAYVVMEGPQFSTRAESALYRSWGASIIGMTAMPEAKLAREAELCYALVAMLTDFDCWHDEQADVTADTVSDRMMTLSRGALDLVAALPRFLPRQQSACGCGCDRALDGAIMTHPDAISSTARTRLGPLLARLTREEARPRTPSHASAAAAE